MATGGTPTRIQIAFDDHRLVNNGWTAPSGISPWPSAWACVNSLTVTSTSGMRRGGRTRETRSDAGGLGAGGRRLH